MTEAQKNYVANSVARTQNKSGNDFMASLKQELVSMKKAALAIPKEDKGEAAKEK